MSLNPDDVREVEFARARHGYDEQQVDDFLDRVIVALEERDGELAQVAAAGPAGPAGDEPEPDDLDEQDALQLLALANRTAREHVVEARAAATKALEAAQQEAASVVTGAREEAASVVAAAREEADRLRAEAIVQHRDALDSLHRERHSLEQRLAELHRMHELSQAQVATYAERLLALVGEPVTEQASRPHVVPSMSA